jgi:hypothetical protein
LLRASSVDTKLTDFFMMMAGTYRWRLALWFVLLAEIVGSRV